MSPLLKYITFPTFLTFSARTTTQQRRRNPTTPPETTTMSTTLLLAIAAAMMFTSNAQSNNDSTRAAGKPSNKPGDTEEEAAETGKGKTPDSAFKPAEVKPSTAVHVRRTDAAQGGDVHVAPQARSAGRPARHPLRQDGQVRRGQHRCRRRQCRVSSLSPRPPTGTSITSTSSPVPAGPPSGPPRRRRQASSRFSGDRRQLHLAHAHVQDRRGRPRARVRRAARHRRPARHRHPHRLDADQRRQLRDRLGQGQPGVWRRPVGLVPVAVRAVRRQLGSSAGRLLGRGARGGGRRAESGGGRDGEEGEGVQGEEGGEGEEGEGGQGEERGHGQERGRGDRRTR
jgi:hypothetical protein